MVTSCGTRWWWGRRRRRRPSWVVVVAAAAGRHRWAGGGAWGGGGGIGLAWRGIWRVWGGGCGANWLGAQGWWWWPRMEGKGGSGEGGRRIWRLALLAASGAGSRSQLTPHLVGERNGTERNETEREPTHLAWLGLALAWAERTACCSGIVRSGGCRLLHAGLEVLGARQPTVPGVLPTIKTDVWAMSCVLVLEWPIVELVLLWRGIEGQGKP